MPIFKRISDILSANLNHLLDQSEHPEKMLKEYLMQANRQLAEVRHEVAIAIAAREKVVGEAAEAQQEIQNWLERARLAVSEKNDGLARKALEHKQRHQQKYDSYMQQLESLDVNVQRMHEALEELQRKIQDAEAQRDVLVSRYQTAHAVARVEEVIGGVGQPGALENLDRMKDKVLTEEARARAAQQLSGSSVEEQFRQLEAGKSSSSVESELAALKAAEEPPSLPSGGEGTVSEGVNEDK